MTDLTDKSPETIEPSSAETPDAAPEKRRKPLWRRILKWFGVTLLSIVGLIVVLFCVALWYLTPERLTPLVNDYMSSYLNADFRASRIELTFWSTFPHLNVQVDGLDIVSHSLSAATPAEKAMLPENADSLVSFRQFKGGINLLDLLKGDISLYDVELTSPRLNIVVVNDSINNFDILPPSESDDTSPMPKISINSFSIKGDFPVRYCMPSDSVDFTLTLSESSLSGDKAPVYTLDLNGRSGNGLLPEFMPPVPFSINGDVHWDQAHPSLLTLSNFTFGILDMTFGFNADFDFTDELLVNRFDLDISRISIGRILALLPDEYAGRLKGMDTDLSLELSMRLLSPYTVGSEYLPDMDLSMKADAALFSFEEMNLSEIDARVNARIIGSDLDRSVIDIDRFKVVERAMNFDISGKITNPVSDPLIHGTFNGSLTFDRMSRRVMAMLPMNLQGTLTGEADFRLRQSWLQPKRFHKVKIDGHLSLSNFDMMMRDSTMNAYIRQVDFNLGTSSRFNIGEHHVDSLLTASLDIDTMAISAPGIRLTGRKLHAGVGSRNVAASSDTSQINPFGGRITADRLVLEGDSSNVRLVLADASVSGSLRRFNREARAPHFNLQIEASRIRYRSDDLRCALRDGRASLVLHPRMRRPMSPRMQARVDSLAAIYPELTADSLRSLAAKEMRRNRRPQADDGRESIDFAVDNSVGAWLRFWQLTGELTADRASFYTHYFPTRNRLSHIDISFSTDSFVVRDTHLVTGHSDFTVNGSVRNISRALTSKRRRQPIEIDFSLNSDTIDINDFTATMIRGAANAENVAAQLMTDPDAVFDDLDRQAEADMEEFDKAVENSAFVVPSNIRAKFEMTASHIHYGNLWLRDFRGTAGVNDGAIKLERIHALTDMGEAELTAMYSAPTRSDIMFAAAANIHRLHLSKLIDEIPALDSIMPVLKEVDGIVDAKMAISSRLDSVMNLDLGSLNMGLNLAGDSLVLLDSDTYRTMAKWLMFKDKKNNMIKHMDVELMVHDGYLDLYPVVFDLDRYRLGIVGGNDMNFNLDYHVAVLKSPLPFKFGINIKGTPENMKIRLGKSRLNEKTVALKRNITDSLRVNLIGEIRRAFTRGVRNAGLHGLRMQGYPTHPAADALKPEDDVLNAADSAVFIREGLIAAPEGYVDPDAPQTDATDKKSKKNKKEK